MHFISLKKEFYRPPELGDLLTVILYNASPSEPLVEIPGKYKGQGKVHSTANIELLNEKEIGALLEFLMKTAKLNPDEFERLFFVWSQKSLGPRETATTRFPIKPI